MSQCTQPNFTISLYKFTAVEYNDKVIQKELKGDFIMKKIWMMLITVMISTMVMTGCGSKDKVGIEGIRDRGKMIVGLDDSFPPMGFRDENNEIVGFDIDLAREVANYIGVDVEFKPVVWETIGMSLNNNDIDMVWNGCTITDARKKEMDFSTPYLNNKQILVVGPDSPIKNKSDLAGKIVALQLGSSSQEALEKDTQVMESLKEVRKFENNVDALMDLKVGRVDAVIVDLVVGRYYISKHPEDYIVLDDSFQDEFYGIGMRKKDTTFITEVNNALKQLHEDGRAAEISENWFGENVFVNE